MSELESETKVKPTPSAPVDTQKVEILKEKIANKTFELHADRIADKIINLEQTLFSTKK